MTFERVCLSVLALVALSASGCGSSERGGAGGGTIAAGSGGHGGAATTSASSSSASSTSSGASGNPGSSSTSTSSSGSSTSSSASTSASSGSSTSSSTSTSSSGGTLACHLPNGYAAGSVTYYTLGMGSTAVNCSFDVVGQNPDVVAHVPFGGGQYFGAMNTADYDTAATCGACVEVHRLDTNQKVSVTIVDQCPTASNPKCKPGHIDLSEQAFLQIGTLQQGYLGTGNGGAVGTISWKYIPCPTTETISFRLKDPTNQYWNQILVMGHALPITKLEVSVGGSWQSATRQSYNYWQVGNGNMGPAPYHVRVTDTAGSTIEAMLALAGGDQHTSQQFPACQ